MKKYFTLVMIAALSVVCIAWDSIPSNIASLHTGPFYFRPGDSIAITNVASDNSLLAIGSTLTIQGTYTLASESNACIGCSTTATERPDRHIAVVEGQWTAIARGSGQFSVTHRISALGMLHVVFFNWGTNSFGTVYFGTAKQMHDMESWNLKKEFENK